MEQNHDSQSPCYKPSSVLNESNSYLMSYTMVTKLLFRALEMQVDLHPDSELASLTWVPFCLILDQDVRIRITK